MPGGACVSAAARSHLSAVARVARLSAVARVAVPTRRLHAWRPFPKRPTYRWRPGFRDIRAALGQATSKPCACLSRNLYDRPLGGGSLPDTVIAQQHNRKCVVTPTSVDDANVHQTRCRGRREEIEDTVCWINHYRNARGLR